MTAQPSHNAISLNTLWGLRLIDDELYESAKGRTPDSPDFETPDRVPAIGGPAAAMVWLLDSGLLSRDEFEAITRATLEEFAQRPSKEARALQRLHILEAVDSEFYNAACSNADEDMRRSNKRRNWAFVGVGAAAVGMIWYVFGPDAVPACQSASVETTVMQLITKSRVISSSSDDERTAALVDTPLLSEIREVGYDRSKRLRGCVAALNYGRLKGPIGYFISPSSGEPLASKDDDRITVRGATADEVHARFKSD
ncbi:hypothetical protein WKR88_05355 [Trinickia caryophylli]|uniref:Uncharacterized protein n=1 Tax=Trinickia caryophylli TaxID=28094 RepID=A0A1X7FKL2_TRICW|nr:hypothetical protein [Trinickia caryophylli]PMS13141.1 hypothetical protein C0Z17_04890 [Trinickia caryophylli]TRX19335.1 hypothetical protein FNF07_14590 [Trinickia caryophylli]WQE13363.1 hypothetical protein U0034_08360 [Trinickia caryophylli]SMF53930.1 hypothetical protein SAMN06295900_109161 [Trinickia caryophylli]GLU34122.1 hypothetical protein Busp01_39640 [Trinickia caryophylli]